MKKLSRNKKIAIVLCLIVMAIISVISVYRYNQLRLLDKAAYKSVVSSIQDNSENGLFTSQNDLRNFITGWADENKLEYTVDKSDNIIFQQKAAAGKKKVSPVVIIVNYNYEVAEYNARLLASAAVIAKTELNSGDKTVIFVNNEDNDGAAYAALSKGYFSDNTKVMYLDSGKSAYISTDSFGKVNQTVTVPCRKEKTSGDVMITVRIGEIPSDCIDTNIVSKTNIVNNLETVLTRMKTRNYNYRIASLKVTGNGEKYPTAITLKMIVKSYNVEAITSYLDQRVEAFTDANKDAYPDSYYEYSLSTNKHKFPATVYTDKATDSLTTMLYTIKNGAYRFKEDSVLAEGFKAGDIYGINCVYMIDADKTGYKIHIITQGLDNDYMKMVTADNRTASQLTDSDYAVDKWMSRFDGENTKLINTLKQTYFKVCDISSSETARLKTDVDKYFTPMSYIYGINDQMEIVHIHMNKESAKVLTNMILSYLNTKGNFMSL